MNTRIWEETHTNLNLNSEIEMNLSIQICKLFEFRNFNDLMNSESKTNNEEYSFMILLFDLLINPKATIASTGILIQTTYNLPSSISLGVSTRTNSAQIAVENFWSNQFGSNLSQQQSLIRSDYLRNWVSELA